MQKNRIAQLEQMYNENPEDIFVRYALALEYASSGKKNIAIDNLKAILDIDKKYLAAYYQLGKIYESIGKIRDAGEVYAQGVQIALEKGDKRTMSELKAAFEGVSGIEDAF